MDYARALISRSRSIYWSVRHSDRANPVGLRILFYHRVSDDHDDLAVTPKRFREHMAYLAREGYRVVDVASAAELLASGALPPRLIALSFDDGYLDVAENALPVLAELGFRATVFVVTGALDGTATFGWYKRPPPVLSWANVVRLDRNSPLAFEAHSVTHPNLLRVGDEAARSELFGCKAALEDRLGRSVSVFCYPGGFFGPRDRALAEAAGYRFAASCEPGVNLPGEDPFTLRRTQIFPRDDLFDFRAKIGGGHDSPLLIRSFYRRLRYGSTVSRQRVRAR
jgi:peptidoglycan/xylan/chitin deacetylase (PgdA/CDA1 family)